MIRTTAEAPFFGLWRNVAVLGALAHPQYLTTARYEPILRRQLGSGHVDLLFESAQQSCIVGGIRLDASNLITRERSPFIWPAQLAAAVDHVQLSAIESAITPWLRSIARARDMATESIRRFTPSNRFDRAREAELVGAAPLGRTMLRMAPFVYARRFATNARVMIRCSDSALAHAVLADIAVAIDQAEHCSDDDAFARAWYGVPAPQWSVGTPDIFIADVRGEIDAEIVVETAPTDSSPARIVDVPSPAPWDLLFSFDAADAPRVSRFSVYASEPPIRPCDPVQPARLCRGSSGTIALAVSVEARTMHGDDFEEAEIFGRRLAGEGFAVRFVSETTDPALADVQLIHIFGAAFEPHTVAFAELALQRGIEYVFDLPPMPADSSAFLENTLLLLCRAALDDADILGYMHAYERRRLDPTGMPEPSSEDYARMEARFAELTGRAVAVFGVEEDMNALHTALPPEVADRISARNVFAEAEPAAGVIGHLVPRVPFAFMHGTISARSHSLYAAIAAERLRVPLVIAGPVHDVDYLQTLRANAPNAVVLADADSCTVSALYRRAAIWVDAAPRPRSAARVMRAVACGALPVLAADSPLSRIAGGDAPTFLPTSFDDCARVMMEAIGSPDRTARIAGLQARLSARRDPTSTFAGIIAAYSRTTIAV